MTTGNELAADLGLSPATVSQILNGKGERFSVATRQLVMERARQLDYRPNAMARATRTGRFGTLALLTITPNWKGFLTEPLMEGLIKGTADQALELLVTACTEASLARLDDKPGLLRQRLFDGMLVNYHMQPSQRIIDAIATCDVPVAWLNTRLPHACIHPDDQQAGLDLGRRLIASGHRRIAYVDGHHPSALLPLCHYSATDRRLGLGAALVEAGLQLRLHVPDERLPDAEQLAFVRALLAGPDRPDAVVAYAPNDAQRVLVSAMHLGLDIPRDLSLAMFAAEPHLHTIPVDTMVIPFAEVGRLAARALVGAIATTMPGPAIAVPFTSVTGHTVIGR